MVDRSRRSRSSTSSWASERRSGSTNATPEGLAESAFPSAHPLGAPQSLPVAEAEMVGGWCSRSASSMRRPDTTRIRVATTCHTAGLTPEVLANFVDSFVLTRVSRVKFVGRFLP